MKDIFFNITRRDVLFLSYMIGELSYNPRSLRSLFQIAVQRLGKRALQSNQAFHLGERSEKLAVCDAQQQRHPVNQNFPFDHFEEMDLRHVFFDRKPAEATGKNSHGNMQIGNITRNE